MVNAVMRGKSVSIFGKAHRLLPIQQQHRLPTSCGLVASGEVSFRSLIITTSILRQLRWRKVRSRMTDWGPGNKKPASDLNLGRPVEQPIIMKSTASSNPCDLASGNRPQQ